MEKKILLISDSLIISIDRSNYAITYMDACNNKVLLTERYERPREAEKVFKERVIYDEQSKRMVKTADGEKEVKNVLHRDTVGYTWKYRNHFDWTDKEAIYGLGCHMEDYLNLQGKELWLCQHNLKAMVPVLNSTAGYGLLFDAGCGMYYNNTAGNGFMEMEAAQQLDYYFMKGVTMDKVINRYRLLTGKSPMLPLYILGYIQSKERYRTSAELIDVVTEYRRRQVPLDVVVQDWNYWPNGNWGYMKMDRKRYPNLRNLTDSIHQLNAKLMVSIWPNPTNSPQTEEFKSKGFMLQRSVYDAFNSDARKLYWKYANDEFFSNGFDAWWCDCTEPVDADWSVMPEGYGWNNQQERWKGNLKALNDLLGEERSSLFSLYHSKGIYENQRATSEKKRVVNLTRSSYAGQQRFATITWNGDTHASWKSFAAQIPGGLNFMAAGCPYWTLDAGAFFSATKKQWFWCGQYDQGVADMGYREFYVRMLQFATFLPLLRSHGTDTPREIWQFGNPGEAFYESILGTINLRYRLLPYIYSLVGAVNFSDYTMSRMLAFDFSTDKKVFDIKDQFMFGPAFLVCPVTKPMYYEKESVMLTGVEKKRDVYLPKDIKWFDFWTGKCYEGGQYLESDAPIERIPLFVRAGTILPMGPLQQYTTEKKSAEWEIRIYSGKDGYFTVYEDEGDGYNYEKGRCATFNLFWNDKEQALTISDRRGNFDGMVDKRNLNVVLVHPGNGVGISSSKGQKIVYEGKKVIVKL